MSETRCMGCMRIKHNTPICEHCGYDARQCNDPNQLPAGTVLQNQYLVGRVLGQGGFGITYMGWDLSLDIPVAIKEYYPNTVVTRNITASTQVFLRNEQSRELFIRNRDRFLREARSLAKLGGEGEVPNIVRVQNLIQANNTAYIIMEFVRGMDLRKYIEQKGRPLTMQETLQLLLPVMQSLEKIHASNIIHRDLSPDNIMVLPNGTTKLIDFGAAHEVRQDELGYQQSTTSIVKHGFAPPEQYTRRGNLGPWTDVYAMSATVYYCLTGRVPPAVQDRQFDGEEICWDHVSTALRNVLSRGLALDVQSRIQTMNELRHSLLAAASEASQKSPANAGTPDSIDRSSRNGGTDTTIKKSRSGLPNRSKVLMALIAAGILLVSGLLLSSHPKDAKKISLSGPPATVETVPESTLPLETTEEVPTEETAPWTDNILMHTYDGLQLLNYGNYYQQTVYRSNIRNDQIQSVTFLDTLADEPADSWDVSHDKNGTVKAWIRPRGNYFDLYIAAEGGINGINACKNMFLYFVNLKEISFGNAFHTEQATTMHAMFHNCYDLAKLELSGFDTAMVTDMHAMFYNCSSLTKLDLSNFHTTKLKNMNSMFSGCSGLTTILLDNFDTSNVQNMSYTFSNCSSLTYLNLRNFKTTNVTSMSDIFANCIHLTDVKNPVLNKELP